MTEHMTWEQEEPFGQGKGSSKGGQWPQGKATTIILLNGHGIKLPSKLVSLDPQFNEALRLHQGSFFVQRVLVQAETHNWSICWEQQLSVLYRATNGISVWQLRLSDTSSERRQRREDLAERVSSGYAGSTVDRTGVTVVTHKKTCTRSIQSMAQQGKGRVSWASVTV